jgi:hypothetical protein
MNRYYEWRRERARVAPLARLYRAAWHTCFGVGENATRFVHVAALMGEAESRFNRNRYRKAKR